MGRTRGIGVNFYATPDYARLTHARVSGGAGPMWLPFALVFGAISFNFFLCFINTKVAGISAAHVMGAEVLIIALALLSSLRSIGLNQIILIFGVFIYLIALSFLRVGGGTSPGGVDIKIIRDFIIPIAFFLLGTRMTNLANADRIVRICAIVVSLLAIFEYFFLDLYLQYFNIIAYYIARGSVDHDQIEWLTNTLYVSGMRPEGRTLLPFLGDHRVSSIFLEPVSPGNFAVTLFFWALVRSKFEKGIYYGVFLMAIFLTIMADNRFGAFLCGLAFCASMIPRRYLHAAVWISPFAAVAALLVVASMYPHSEINNSFSGRMLYSGLLLSGFDIWDWLGVGKASVDGDSGYAYTISQIGFFGFVAFWGLLMMLKRPNSQFQMFRAFCGMYLAAILCVSSSPYTIKTAGLVWFLLGALSTLRGHVLVSAPTPDRHLTAMSTPDFETTPSR